MTALPHHVIPTDLKPLLRRLLTPSAGVPGWALASCHVGRSEVRALYVRPAERLRAEVTLAHPEAFPHGVPVRTVKFALGFRASAPHPSVRDLFSDLVASVRVGEHAFEWSTSDAPARAPAPEVPVVLPNLRDCAREIDHHLDLVPWIDLGVAFDHAACFREATALLDRFATHQSGAEGEYAAGWKSLAIRAKGGELHRGSTYGYRVPDGPADESWTTEIAAEVPGTMSLLEQIALLDRVTAARFMVLEPGGCIPAHSDDLTNPVSHSLNVAFNMPPGCEFWVDLEPDGARGPYARLAPFRDGTALILNVARHHAVTNASAVPRVHLKVEGPWRLGPAEVLAIARRQNGTVSLAEVCVRLVEKYRALGRPISPGTALHEDATRLGLLA